MRNSFLSYCKCDEILINSVSVATMSARKLHLYASDLVCQLSFQGKSNCCPDYVSWQCFLVSEVLHLYTRCTMQYFSLSFLFFLRLHNISILFKFLNKCNFSLVLLLTFKSFKLLELNSVTTSVTLLRTIPFRVSLRLEIRNFNLLCEYRAQLL